MTKQARSFAAGGTAFSVLLALGLSHMLNDTLQTLIAAIYPLIKQSLTLSFSQIGLITLVFQFSSSVFQPVVGWYTDKKPQPYSLPVGMTSTLCGLFLLAFSNSLGMVLISVTLIGIGRRSFRSTVSSSCHSTVWAEKCCMVYSRSSFVYWSNVPYQPLV